MLFPSSKYRPGTSREWFLVPHDGLFKWVKQRHGHTGKWVDAWSYPYLNKALREFLKAWEVRPVVDPTMSVEN